MPVIKGPIKIKGSEFKEFLKGKCMKFKPPFEATGWKSSKMPEGADLSGLKLKKDEPVKEKVKPQFIDPPKKEEEASIEEPIFKKYDKVEKEEPKAEPEVKKIDFDFNNDGKVDSKDTSLAAKLMAKSRKYKKSKKKVK